MFSFLKKKDVQPEEKIVDLKAFLTGKVIPMEEVEDEVFSSKALGDGVAIVPTSNVLKAPASGEVTVTMEDSKHAVGMKLANGVEILLHVGLDTVTLGGEGFELFVKVGDTVKTGDKLIQFDGDFIKAKGFPITTVLAVTDPGEYTKIQYLSGMDANETETVIAKF